MKILHVDDTFHPNFGYQCTPLAKFQQRAGNEVYVIAPEAKYIYPVYHSFGEYGETLDEDDARYEKETGVKIIRVGAKGYVLGRLVYRQKELIRAIDKICPDVILVHCMETITAMYLMKKLRRKYPMALDSHMLAMATKNKFHRVYETGYRLLFTSTIKKEKYPVIKTQDDDYVSEYLGVPKEQTLFLSFGTDTILFSVDRDAKKRFLAEKNLPQNTFVVCSTGKLSESKGGMLLADAVKKKFDGDRPVAVVIVANFGGSYEQTVKERLDESENHVFYYPVQKYNDLPYFYQIADVTVFPKQCSMSFYDAQSCGCPTITEKGHVNEERHSHGNGFCFDCGDVNDFRGCIQALLSMPENEYEKMRDNAYNFVATQYSYDLIAKQYTDVLQNAIEIFESKYKTKKS